MNDPSELHQTAGLTQLAEVKRAARRIPLAETAGGGEQIARDQPAAAPAPWQFRLRTMLAVVAGISGLFAIMHLIGAVWSAILIWFSLLAIAHVTANFWGTRMAPRESRVPGGDLQPDFAASALRATAPRGAVRLRESRRPGWPMLAATAAGALTGGLLGGLALVFLSLDRAGYAGVVVGTISAAIVGGFLGFLASSFAVIALRAWTEALSNCQECDDVSPLSTIAKRPSPSVEDGSSRASVATAIAPRPDLERLTKRSIGNALHGVPP